MSDSDAMTDPNAVSYSNAIVVLCTAPDEASAQNLAAQVLGRNWPPVSRCCRGRPHFITGKVNSNKSMRFSSCSRAILTISRPFSLISNNITPTRRRNYWCYRYETEIKITCHGSTLHYSDPAAVQRITRPAQRPVLTLW